jgi:hypothetical protein
MGGALGQNWVARDLISPMEHTGGPTGALDWVTTNGLADYGCYPWYNGDHDYSPTCDRSGRTVRIGPYTNMGDITQQKTWLNNIGPIICSIDCYDDFGAWSPNSGVPYRPAPTAVNIGGHCMLIVGYDDTKNCWIVRNSWGPNLGDGGYWLIAYGVCNIDYYSKQGLQIVNPDPWTRRRLHNGCMIQSGNGAAHRNFELIRGGAHIQHLWREGSSPWPWANAGNIVDPNDKDPKAGTDCLGHPAMTSTSNDRNFDVVYGELGGKIRHWTFKQMMGVWVDHGLTPVPATGYPGFIQSNFGDPGQFEIVVRNANGSLDHWSRPASNFGVPGYDYYRAETFGTNGTIKQSGPSLVQSNVGTKGNFYCCALLNTGEMQMFWKNNDTGASWTAGEIFGAGFFNNTPPCMIQSQSNRAKVLEVPESKHPAVGNFELCIAAPNGQIQHWWRNNETLTAKVPVAGHVTPQSNNLWQYTKSFGSGITNVWGLIEGSFNFDLELIAQRNDGLLQHFWRDSVGDWHDGPILNI